jgi:pimeloyl-ACP methyl ester carboxylesterase
MSTRIGIKEIFQKLVHALGGLLRILAVWLAFFVAMWASRGAGGGYVALGCAIVLAGALWWRGWRQRSRGASVRRAVVMLLVLAPLGYLMIPLASSVLPSLPADATAQLWPTGPDRKVAVYRYPPADVASANGLALVFVHGGPGAYVRDFDRRFFAEFARDGFDVVLYDQFGAGQSPLGDVRTYTHQNNVNDLVAVLERVNKPVVLVGQSYGATLVTSALMQAEVRDRVKYVVLTEPGKIPGAAFSFSPMMAEKTTRAPDGAQPPSVAVLAKLAAPRALLASLLPADQRYVSQEELINHYTPDVQHALVANAFCKGDTGLLEAFETERFNLLANFGISRDARGSPTPDLAGLSSPVLLLLGECSYIPRGRAMEYFDVYRIARSHLVPGVGHVPWGNERGQRLTREAIVRFVAQQPGPLPNEPTASERNAFVSAGR